MSATPIRRATMSKPISSSPYARALQLPADERRALFRRQLSTIWHSGVAELQKRFQAAHLGGVWLFLGPALLMGVYWFVFDKIDDVEFTDPGSGRVVPFLAPFSIGFVLYLTFGEFINNGAGWFRSKRRMITETDLPLWAVFSILPVRVFLQFVGYIIVAIGICALYGLVSLPNLVVYLCGAMLIFFMFCGVSLFIALIGAFFGDIKEISSVAMRVLFYSSSITFPLTLIPESLRWIPMLNPLTWGVELSRELLLWNGADALIYLTRVGVGAAVIWLLALFMYWRLARVVDQVV